MDDTPKKPQHSVALSHDDWAILAHLLRKAETLIPHVPHGQHATLANLELGYILTLSNHHGHTFNVTISRLDGDPIAAPSTGFPGSGGFGAAYAAWTLVEGIEEGES